MMSRFWLGQAAMWLFWLVLPGCGPSNEGVRMVGSDTMVNVARRGRKNTTQEPGNDVQVLGGGSGVGHRQPDRRHCDMANASRKMEEKEIERVKAKSGVSPENTSSGTTPWPSTSTRTIRLDSISLDELAEIYR